MAIAVVIGLNSSSFMSRVDVDLDSIFRRVVRAAAGAFKMFMNAGALLVCIWARSCELVLPLDEVDELSSDSAFAVRESTSGGGHDSHDIGIVVAELSLGLKNE